MESFEFLGGRYNRPEQIMSGPVQAFRAQNAANGRNVFIHRVSTTESPEEQSALLKLLTTALVKSSDTKRLVLDFGEERGYWYVVTESEPQCALLMEWLQLEIDAALAGSKPIVPLAGTPIAKPPVPSPNAAPGEFTRFLQQQPPLSSPSTASRPGALAFSPPPAPPAPVPPARPETPQPIGQPLGQPSSPPAGETPGEFSRFFQSRPTNPASPNALTPPSSPGAPGVAPSSIPEAVPLRPPPGEFTSFFNASDADRKNRPLQQPPAPPPFQGQPYPQQQPSTGPPQSADPAQKEAGEFTRFFTPGLPVGPPKPTAPAPPGFSLERTQTSQFVQRPNSPIPPPPPASKSAEAGEFTKMFSRPEFAASPQQVSYRPPAVRGDPMGFAKPPSNQLDDLHDKLFKDKMELGAPLPSSQPPPGEFTSVFGAVGSGAPPVPPAGVVAPPRDKSLLDESQGTQQFPVRPLPPAEAESPGGSSGGTPSDFTMIMKGGYGPSKAAAGSPAAGPAAGGGQGGSGIAPIGLNISPVNPMAAMSSLGSVGGSVAGVHASASQHGASANSALGSAHLNGPHIPAANLRVPPADLQIPSPGKTAANKKLIIFFALLGLLALVLIVVIMFLMKSK